MNTKIITWNEERGFEADELAEAAQFIREGGLVAFPTETVYGLGGNGLDPQASQKIYAAKGRPSDNPLILLIAKIDQFLEVVSEIPDAAAVRPFPHLFQVPPAAIPKPEFWRQRFSPFFSSAVFFSSKDTEKEIAIEAAFAARDFPQKTKTAIANRDCRFFIYLI